MDSRYLFRGKRVDGFKKNWVVGHYVSVPCPMIVRPKAQIGGRWDCDDIDPVTVGQCTGICDKNGILIFEGDIVKIGYLVYKVIWGYAQYKFEIISDKDCCFPYFYSNAPKCEVIGNIHDNPGLLEENDD